MIVLDDHKEQILLTINHKIHKIDHQCNILTNKIYEYSQQKMQQLEEIVKKNELQLKQQQSLKHNNLAYLNKLKTQMRYLQRQQNEYEQIIKGKQISIERLEKKCIYLDEKHKEEEQYVEGFKEQKEKSKVINSKIKYAKSKLNMISKELHEKQTSVQYKWRLIQLMKAKNNQLSKQQALCHEQSRENSNGEYHYQSFIDASTQRQEGQCIQRETINMEQKQSERLRFINFYDQK